MIPSQEVRLDAPHGSAPEPLNIVVYGINFEPELTGCGKYTGEMCRWLAARGHHVDVVTAPPYYPQWRILDGHHGWRYAQDLTQAASGLRVLRCPLWVPAQVTGKKRLLHLASFAASSALGLLFTLLRQRPDVMVLVAPTLACAPAALALSKLFRVPVWLHVQDFEVDAMHAMGLVKQAGTLRRLALACESWIMKRFDHVSSISDNMVSRLHDKGVDASRTSRFLNWVDVSMIRPQSRAHVQNKIRDQLQVTPDQTLVLYAGNLGQKQGIEVVIDAAKQLSHRQDIVFAIVGTGSALAELQARANGLDRVRWLPLQPIELLNELLNAADIHVLPQRADAADLVMPSKLTGMLSSGRPVIGTAAAATQLGKVLDECGIRVEPGCADALSRAITQLVLSRDEQHRLGELGRQYALTHLSHEAVLGGFEEGLTALAAQHRHRVTA